MTTFLLVHGAWHGGWCWDRLGPLLSARGHRVMAPDLPGMGASELPVAAATLDLWSGFVAELAKSAAEPVVLVGHSRGGVVISAAAERAPHAVRSLAYLTAILLPDGAHALGLADQMSGEGLAAMRLSADGASTRLAPEAAAALLYNTTPAQWVKFALARLGPDPTEPNLAPLSLTPEGYGSVRRRYIECRRDNTLPIGLQRRMQADQPCLSVTTLDTDHSPFFSAPDLLADILCAFED